MTRFLKIALVALAAMPAAPAAPAAAADPADLSVEITENSASFPAGVAWGFLMVVRNAGPGTAASAKAVINVPADARGIEWDDGWCTLSRMTLTCPLGDLPPGYSYEQRVSFRFGSPGARSVSVESRTTAKEPNSANNVARWAFDVVARDNPYACTATVEESTTTSECSVELWYPESAWRLRVIESRGSYGGVAPAGYTLCAVDRPGECFTSSDGRTDIRYPGRSFSPDAGRWRLQETIGPYVYAGEQVIAVNGQGPWCLPQPIGPVRLPPVCMPAGTPSAQHRVPVGTAWGSVSLSAELVF